MKRRNKRNERERQEKQEKQVETTIEELKDKWITMYFDNEEEMEWYIKYHKIKNFEYAGHQPRTIIFPASELIKEEKEK